MKDIQIKTHTKLFIYTYLSCTNKALLNDTKILIPLRQLDPKCWTKPNKVTSNRLSNVNNSEHDHGHTCESCRVSVSTCACVSRSSSVVSAPCRVLSKNTLHPPTNQPLTSIHTCNTITARYDSWCHIFL